MDRLTEIGLKHNTDKAYGHGFTSVYNTYFEQYTNPRILEIGVYNGASMETYNEFFNYRCNIVGVDNGEQLGYMSTHPNIQIVIADQDRPVELANAVGGMYDIILDDGSHFVEHQINCYEVLKQKVNKGGIYIIEDLHCCYHSFYNPNNVKNTIEYLQDLKNNLPEYIESIEIFSDKPLAQATNTSHITSVIKFK
jgi:hypothetical protein